MTMCGFVAESPEVIKDKIRKVVGSGHLKIKDKQFKLIFDTGASIHLTPDKSDFVEFTETPSDEVIQGIGTGLKIQGKGLVEYMLNDTSGNAVKLKLTAYWVPTLPKGVRLISPQVITTAEGDGGLFIVPPSKIDNVRDPDAEC